MPDMEEQRLKRVADPLSQKKEMKRVQSRVAENIEAWIVAKHTTAAAVAKVTGIDPSAFSNWGKGSRFPSLQSALLICRALGITIGQLVDELKLPPSPDPLGLSTRHQKLLDAYDSNPVVRDMCDAALRFYDAETKRKG